MQYYGHKKHAWREINEPFDNKCSTNFPDRHAATWSITAQQLIDGKPIRDTAGPASVDLATALENVLPDGFASSNCDPLLPPCVTIHLGTNDIAIRNWPFVTPLMAKGRVESVANQITNYFKTEHNLLPVILLAAPIKTSKDLTQIWSEVDELADLINAIEPTNSATKQQYIVDMNTGFFRGNLRDNVHPNVEGENFLRDQWFDAVMAHCMPDGARSPPPPRWLISPSPSPQLHYHPPPPPPPPQPPPPPPPRPPAKAMSCYERAICSRNKAECFYGHEEQCATGGTNCDVQRNQGNLLACMRCYGCAHREEARDLLTHQCFWIKDKAPSAPGGRECEHLEDGLIGSSQSANGVSLGWDCPAYCVGEHCRLPACQNWVCQRDALRCQAYIGLVDAATAPSVPPRSPVAMPSPPPPAPPPDAPSPPTPPGDPPSPPFHPWPPHIPEMSPHPPKPWAPAPLPPQPVYPPNSPRPHPPPGSPPYPPNPPAMPHPPAAPPFPPHPPFVPPSPPSYPPMPPPPSYPYGKRRLEKKTRWMWKRWWWKESNA